MANKVSLSWMTREFLKVYILGSECPLFLLTVNLEGDEFWNVQSIP